MNGADVTGDYSHIERTFAKINMRDAWMYPGQLHRNDGGYTCRYTDGSDSENEKDFSNVGAVLAEQDPALSMLTTYCKDDVPGKGYAPPPTREGHWENGLSFCRESDSGACAQSGRVKNSSAIIPAKDR